LAKMVENAEKIKDNEYGKRIRENKAFYDQIAKMLGQEPIEL